MAFCSSGAPGVSGEEIGGPWVSASPEGGVRERWREQRTCVAGGAGPLSGMEGSLPGSRRPPQERERLFVRAGLQLRGAGRNSGPFSSVVPSGGPRG